MDRYEWHTTFADRLVIYGAVFAVATAIFLGLAAMVAVMSGHNMARRIGVIATVVYMFPVLLFAKDAATSGWAVFNDATGGHGLRVVVAGAGVAVAAVGLLLLLRRGRSVAPRTRLPQPDAPVAQGPVEIDPPHWPTDDEFWRRPQQMDERRQIVR